MISTKFSMLLPSGPLDPVDLKKFQYLTSASDYHSNIIHLYLVYASCKMLSTGILHNPTFQTWLSYERDEYDKQKCNSETTKKTFWYNGS